MPLNIAVQMDDWSTVNVDADSTFALMLEAQRRGHSLFVYLPTALTYDRGSILARGTPAQVQRDQANMAQLGKPEMREVADFDVVLMRQDPGEAITSANNFANKLKNNNYSLASEVAQL